MSSWGNSLSGLSSSIFASVLPVATMLALVVSQPARAQMQVGDVMTAGGFSPGAACKDSVARDQRAANNWNNAGQPQNELTVSQGGKLPDPMMAGGASGGGGSSTEQSTWHESPVKAARAYTKYPSGYYNMGKNRNNAVGLADGRQHVDDVEEGHQHGSGGGGGEFIPAGLAGRGNAYGSFAGSRYGNASSNMRRPSIMNPSPLTGPSQPANAGIDNRAACCKANLPCCAAKWPCCGSMNEQQQQSPSNSKSGSGGSNPITIPQLPLNSQQGNAGQGEEDGGCAGDAQNCHQVTTPPETEPMTGPPQIYAGLSAPMAANMQDLMGQAGLNGPQGGKMIGAAEVGILGMASSFQQLKAANMPGASAEQAKVNQNAEKSQTADNLAGMEREQAATAIDFVRSYLENFTTNGGNKWNRLRDNLFVPIGILLLLPGAVLAQVKSIVSQGFSVLGEVNPWEGILRAMVGIFLIPATYLIMNYGIDVANSLTKTIADQYRNIFGTDMYEDAFSGHVRAFPIRLPEENYSVIPNIEATMYNYFGNSPLARLEGKLLAIKYEDPAVNLYIVPENRAAETVPFLVNEARLMYNRINAGLAFAWTILCAVQQCYLYYLWFVGPVVAALWIYPMGQLRQAFPNWMEGVVSLCFWSFFWSTTILLMACYRGVDDTGTIIFTALNFLALGSVKFAFDFSGLVKDAGREAARLAEKTSRMAATGGKPSPAPGPGPGPNPNPNPGPGHDPDPDKIDPLHPQFSHALASNTTNTTEISNSTTVSSNASRNLIEGGETPRITDGIVPAFSTLAASNLTPPSVDHPEPPLSNRGIQVASLEGGVFGSDTLNLRGNNYATDYPTQSWAQTANDANQTKSVDGRQVDNKFGLQDQQGEREQRDRAYQEQQQEQQRKDQEKRQQEMFVQAEMQANKQQSEQMKQQEQQQQQQLQQLQAAQTEQDRMAQFRAMPEAFLQGQGLPGQGLGELPPSSQKPGQLGLTDPANPASPLRDGALTANQLPGQGVPGATNLPGLPGVTLDPSQTIPGGQNLVNGNNLPPGTTPPDATLVNLPTPGAIPGTENYQGPPLTNGNTVYTQNGDAVVVNNNGQTTVSTNNDSTYVASNGNPAAPNQYGQPAQVLQSPQQVVDSNTANAYTHTLPQNVLAPGSSTEVRHLWDGNPNQIVQSQTVQTNSVDPAGLRTIGQVVQNQPGADTKPTSDKSPLNYVDLG